MLGIYFWQAMNVILDLKKACPFFKDSSDNLPDCNAVVVKILT